MLLERALPLLLLLGAPQGTWAAAAAAAQPASRAARGRRRTAGAGCWCPSSCCQVGREAWEMISGRCLPHPRCLHFALHFASLFASHFALHFDSNAVCMVNYREAGVQFWNASRWVAGETAKQVM